MAKPVPVRVPSDDCTVIDAGVAYTPHEGEWVEMFLGLEVRDMRLFRTMAELPSRIAAIQPPPVPEEGFPSDAERDAWFEMQKDASVRELIMTDDTHDEMVRILQDRIVAWNWTDKHGRPYPNPQECPDVVRGLRLEELLYLTMLVRTGESKVQRKNGLRPLPTTASASRRTRSRTA